MAVQLVKAPVVVAQPLNTTYRMMNQLTHYIKSCFVGTLLLSELSLQAVEAPDYSSYARLLKTYVEDEGVHYAKWVKNQEDVIALQEFVKLLGQVDIDALSEADQAALYINLYNAAMLCSVLEEYPIRSVKAIGTSPFSVFKKDFIALADRKVSLDEIEKGILLKDYFDPRIHFTLNCASESCPPLRTEPFGGDQLEKQMEEQAKLFANSDRAAQVDRVKKSIAYSELFKWYADDFDVENPAEYLNKYRYDTLPTSYSVDWIKYDWALNEITEKEIQ